FWLMHGLGRVGALHTSDLRWVHIHGRVGVQLRCSFTANLPYRKIVGWGKPAHPNILDRTPCPPEQEMLFNACHTYFWSMHGLGRVGALHTSDLRWVHIHGRVGVQLRSSFTPTYTEVLWI